MCKYFNRPSIFIKTSNGAIVNRNRQREQILHWYANRNKLHFSLHLECIENHNYLRCTSGAHYICKCWIQSLRKAANENLQNERGLGTREKSVSLFAPLCLPRNFFFHFTNSFQWLSNWKMEMLLLPSISAAASWQQSNFLSSGINGIEQYIRIKKPVIAGLPVCHLSRKSSPPDLSRVLSELIMSSIKSKKNPEKSHCSQLCNILRR